jgi:hypothetical protein
LPLFAAVDSGRAVLRPEVDEAPIASPPAYESDFFTAWCSEFGLDPLPATPDTVRAYLASLVREKHKASTIRRRRAATAATQAGAGFVTSALKSGADVFKAADQGR